jgi:hypothetical protein
VLAQKVLKDLKGLLDPLDLLGPLDPLDLQDPLVHKENLVQLRRWVISPAPNATTTRP